MVKKIFVKIKRELQRLKNSTPEMKHQRITELENKLQNNIGGYDDEST